jgi:hypothetical protein
MKMVQQAGAQWGGASGQGNEATAWGRRNERQDGPSPKLSGALAVASVVTMLFALFTPWYFYEQESDDGHDLASYDFWGVAINSRSSPRYYTDDWGDRQEYTPSDRPVKTYSDRLFWTDDVMQKDSRLYTATKALVVLSVVAGFVQAAIAALACRRKWGRTAFAAAGAVCLALMLAAPVILMAGHPAMISSMRGGASSGEGPWASFIGSSSSFDTARSWGPHIGWLLMIVAVAFSAASVLPLVAHNVRSRRNVAPAPLAAWYPPAPFPTGASWASAPGPANFPSGLDQPALQDRPAPLQPGASWAPAATTTGAPAPAPRSTPSASGFPPMEARR